ncbi:nuclear transport factor 2 family protein [Ruegeria atlantica]|uniref:nuclear transport factor 2 family protein n=1 Tax=Ruegeria atlantica TaxID=81569 RepID=UPI0024945375|nr:nuclear transport factor 2 family protein [Ruegeria atlantica]
MTPKEVVLNAVAAIFTNFDPEAAEQLLAPGYIQHNPAVPTGAAPIVGFIPGLKESGIEVTTHRVLAEGDLVVLHNTYTNAQAFGAEALVGFDVFRVEDRKVVEHWDNLEAVTEPNPSGHTQTDGAVEIVDLNKTEANKELVVDFVNTILRDGKGDQITDFISTETYTQHNSQIADGLDGLGAALTAWAEQGITMKYDETHLVVAEGNFVFTASEGTLAGTPTAFFDLFRVEDGKIVEHWDVISDIPSEMAHENGKF